MFATLMKKIYLGAELLSSVLKSPDKGICVVCNSVPLPGDRAAASQLPAGVSLPDLNMVTTINTISLIQR